MTPLASSVRSPNANSTSSSMSTSCLRLQTNRDEVAGQEAKCWKWASKGNWNRTQSSCPSLIPRPSPLVWLSQVHHFLSNSKYMLGERIQFSHRHGNGVLIPSLLLSIRTVLLSGKEWGDTAEYHWHKVIANHFLLWNSFLTETVQPQYYDEH
jgi:hypothetical protein